MKFFTKLRKKLLLKISSIIQLSNKLKSKSVFIDCGAYDGCSAIKASILHPFIKEIISFEADPRMWTKEASIVSTLIPVAVWIYNGQIDFQIITKNKYGGQYAGAGSLVEEKQQANKSMHREVQLIKVPCIDLVDWIKKNYKSSDQIILKLDIEGAEYAILKKLIEEKLYYFINILYIEWHPKFSPFTAEVTEEIRRETYEKFSNVEDWDALNFSIVDKENSLYKAKNIN
mgnify:CR=1 FL=1|tara:strand:- start:964 stop:1653 length:690 start_codon:yes stop_codon:yes gene_type:complete